MKYYNTIGCCGIDCGLCPRFVSQSASACPGCGAPNFYEKHPSCGFLTCCGKNHGLEVCAECNEYPCKRFDPEREGYDSFVTHKKVFHNQEMIQKIGINNFMEEQRHRIEILDYMIKNFDNGRSKSFFCLACALLPIAELQKSFGFASSIDSALEIKEKNKLLRDRLLIIAEKRNIVLRLNKK